VARARTRRPRRAITAALAIGAALLAACGGDAPGPQRDAAGAITEPGEARLLKLRIGDCVANLRTAFECDDGGHNGVPLVRAVPCTYLHDGEVLQITPIESASYPGPPIIDGEAARGRLDLEPRIDRARAQTGLTGRRELELLTFRPTDNRWDFENQREILYLAVFSTPRRGRL